MTFLDLDLSSAPHARPNAPSRPATPGPHLTSVSRHGWTWWRHAVLRSAGFPAHDVKRLADAGLGARADGLATARDRWAEQLRAAREVLRDAAIAARRADASAARDSSMAPAALRRAEKSLARGDIDATAATLLHPDLQASLEAAWRHLVEQERRYGDAFEAFQRQQVDDMAALAGDPRLRAAIGWQNHAAVSDALNPLAERTTSGGSKRRQREALLANYVQRYCVKNDTIGFFGPMAWVTLDFNADIGKGRVGDRVVRGGSVHFEDWVIQAIADQWAADDRFLNWTVPRLQPFLALEGGELRMPGGARIALPPKERLLLSMCDGTRRVRDIVGQLLANPFGPFGQAGEIHALLRKLQQAQRLCVALPLPSGCADADALLSSALKDVDEPLRAEARGQLDRLVAARDVVRHAAGAEDLIIAMRQADAIFQEITGSAGRRHQGQAYGGRGLLYEDCARDVDLQLTSEALAPLRSGLDLVMTSARWLLDQSTRVFEAAFDEAFDALAASSDPAKDGVAFTDFWLKMQPYVFGEHTDLDRISHELRARWEAILQPFADPDGGAVHLALADVEDQVRAAFPAGTSGWNLARYQCPDVMFCADSMDALLRGQYLAVLGEVHLGGNTLGTNLFFSQHPERDVLRQALRDDLGQRYVLAKLSPEASNTPVRTQWPSDPEACREVLFSKDVVPANAATSVSIGELTVVRRHGALVVRRSDGGPWESSLLDVLGDFLFLAVINRFGVVNKRRHTPRVTVGSLVLQRESWRFAAGELSGCFSDEASETFLAVRAWRRAVGLPDCVFVKVPWEDKPFFVDFDSPLFVRGLARQVRNAVLAHGRHLDQVTFSEMLPSLNQLWLRDRDGRTYTSELRLVGLHVDDLPAGRA